MFKRKITKKFLEWKAEEAKPCLLVRGARQVGKTFIVDDFAKNNYEYYIYINFEEQPRYKEIFAGDLDFPTLREKLEVEFPDQRIEKGKTILFLDEIQACPNARVALKPLALDGTLDVIASGSLLGLYYKEVRSYPVGYERAIDLYPLDFEEYLWALGMSEKLTESFHGVFTGDKKLENSTIASMHGYFREHMLTGGMPNAVKAYLKDKSPQDLQIVQRALIENYKTDILKYAAKPDKYKILRTFESIPTQLAKKNKKFVFSDISSEDENPSERKYGSAINWLKDAGIVDFCFNLTEPALPLASNRKLETYKLYMRDTGLLISMMEPDTQKAIVFDNLYINEGGIVENACASELVAHDHPLTYFERKSSLEIDFVLNLNGIATAIEIKSVNNAQAKSLKTIIERYKTAKRYIKFEPTTEVYISADGVEHYPLFMIAFL